MKNDNGEHCPRCGEETLHFSQGIIECSECGWWCFDKEDGKNG